ncbi:hypothetical protein AB0E10_26295 [Streptomyces sp. NPDC048045]|uniref:hypothetical protein n=1 Tax=Streptomyces sp. NPDC048045 TaxID=3154710 RepID=UPI00341DC231
MHTEIRLLARLHAADLRAQADAHRLAVAVKPAGELRSRVGWALVGVGLRLAGAPEPVVG